MRKKPIPKVISQEDVYSLGLRLYDPQLQALYYTIYLTGAKISPILSLKRGDIYKNKGTLIFKIKGKDIPIQADIKYEKKMIKDVVNYFNQFEYPKTSCFKMRRRNAYNRLRRMLKIFVQAVREDTGEIIEGYSFRMHPEYIRRCRAKHLKESKPSLY